MVRDEFLDKAPPLLGDILWEHLEILQKGKFSLRWRFYLGGGGEKRRTARIIMIILMQVTSQNVEFRFYFLFKIIITLYFERNSH